MPLVSVIVPARNAARFLETTLTSLRSQTYPRIEIIVVDNSSTDATREIASRFADVVVEKGPERTAQLNWGAKIARGDLVYRVDADFLVDVDVIAQAVERIKDGADAVAVHNDSTTEGGYLPRIRHFERSMYRGDTLIVAARFFRRSVFFEVGGFDEQMVVAEDLDLHNRLLRAGYRIDRIEAGELHLDEPTSFLEFARKQYYYGTTALAFIRKSGSRGMSQLNPVRGAFLRNWRRLVRHPDLTVGLVLMTIIKAGAGFAGLSAALFQELRATRNKRTRRPTQEGRWKR